MALQRNNCGDRLLWGAIFGLLRNYPTPSFTPGSLPVSLPVLNLSGSYLIAPLKAILGCIHGGLVYSIKLNLTQSLSSSVALLRRGPSVRVARGSPCFSTGCASSTFSASGPPSVFTTVPNSISASTDCQRWVGERWAYRLSIAGDFQPPSAIIVRSFAPFMVRRLAKTCRMSWNLNGLRPLFLISLSQE